MSLGNDLSIDNGIGQVGGVDNASAVSVDNDIEKLKQDAKRMSLGFRVSMALTGLLAVTAVALKALFLVGAMTAFSLTPFGWAALGLVAIAMICIAVRRYKEGQIEGLGVIGHGIDPNESMKTEAKKGLMLMIPFYGWYKVIKEESSELQSYSVVSKTPSCSSLGGSSGSSGRGSPELGVLDDDFLGSATPPPNGKLPADDLAGSL